MNIVIKKTLAVGAVAVASLLGVSSAAQASDVTLDRTATTTLASLGAMDTASTVSKAVAKATGGHRALQTKKSLLANVVNEEDQAAVVGVDDVSVGNGSLNNVAQCIAVPKWQIPVAVNGIGGAVPVAVQDIKPPIVLPEVNVLGNRGDTSNSTVITEVTGNNMCTGGSGNGAGSGTGTGSGNGAAKGAGAGSAAGVSAGNRGGKH